jgi:hypothetical protein
VQLHRDREEFERAGARLVVIGQGTPAHARDFQRRQKVDLPMYVDPGRESYAAAGTKIATVGELVGPKQLVRGIKTTVGSKVHQGMVVGHVAQLGGVMLVTPDGEVPYSHLSDEASDVPPNEEVLAAVRRLRDA